MPDRTSADSAAIEHIFTTLAQQIADANRMAKSHEASAKGALAFSRGEKYRESAEFHRALAARLGDVVEVAKAKFAEAAAAFPGDPGALWHDADGDLWVHCADGQMRLVTETEEPDSPAELERHAGPMMRMEEL